MRTGKDLRIVLCCLLLVALSGCELWPQSTVTNEPQPTTVPEVQLSSSPEVICRDATQLRLQPAADLSQAGRRRECTGFFLPGGETGVRNQAGQDLGKFQRGQMFSVHSGRRRKLGVASGTRTTGQRSACGAPG